MLKDTVPILFATVVFATGAGGALAQSQLPKYEIIPYLRAEGTDATGAKLLAFVALRVDRVTGKFTECTGTFNITAFQQNPAKPALSVSCQPGGFAVGIGGLQDKAVAVPVVSSAAQKDLEILWLIDVKTGAVQFCHPKPGCTPSLQVP